MNWYLIMLFLMLRRRVYLVGMMMLYLVGVVDDLIGVTYQAKFMVQIACALLLITSQLLAVRVENGGIWLAPSWETTGIAVVLCVLVSIATVLSGPPLQDLEDDDYEFDQEL